MEGRKTSSSLSLRAEGLSGSKGYHKPVLLREVIEALGVKVGRWYLDATLGDGGHSLEILRLGGNVVGIDVDAQAIERSKRRLGKLGKVKLVQGNFRDLKNLIQSAFAKASADKQTETKFAGALFDLGVSSLQLESPKRGFSFMYEGPLDMRMDLSLQVRALDLIKAGGRKELSELFSRLGEEKYSWALADAVVRAREIGRIETTRQLAQIIENATGRKRGLPAGRQGKIHPATKVFQALRIAVNDELNALREGLPQALEVTLENGHILVISFHSLEDRITKNIFRQWEQEGLGEIITRKPVIPSEVEIRENPRSRSAKLRIFEKK